MIPKLITRRNLTDWCKNLFSQAHFSSFCLPLLAFLCKQPTLTFCSPDSAALLGALRHKCPELGRLDIWKVLTRFRGFSPGVRQVRAPWIMGPLYPTASMSALVRITEPPPDSSAQKGTSSARVLLMLSSAMTQWRIEIFINSTQMRGLKQKGCFEWSSPGSRACVTDPFLSRSSELWSHIPVGRSQRVGCSYGWLGPLFSSYSTPLPCTLVCLHFPSDCLLCLLTQLCTLPLLAGTASPFIHTKFLSSSQMSEDGAAQYCAQLKCHYCHACLGLASLVGKETIISLSCPPEKSLYLNTRGINKIFSLAQYIILDCFLDHWICD